MSPGETVTTVLTVAAGSVAIGLWLILSRRAPHTRGPGEQRGAETHMRHEFTQLVGAIIHHCGALELLTNNTITALGTDRLLSSEMVKAPFSKRISLLRRLLRDRTELAPGDVKSLCDELEEVARKRNAVAHNAIAYEDPDKPESACILVVRFGPEDAGVKEEIGREELRSLVDRTNQAIRRFRRLVPCSTEA